jgi:hypothetical protein
MHDLPSHFIDLVQDAFLSRFGGRIAFLSSFGATAFPKTTLPAGKKKKPNERFSADYYLASKRTRKAARF